AYNMEHTYPNRIKVPNSPQRASWTNIKKGLFALGNILLRVGVFGNYRETFWKFADPALKAKNIESVIHVGLIAHHLITFAQECRQGQESASFYSQKIRQAEMLPIKVSSR
ncbi:MAG: DUF4070 domain-containing protein, partial [Phormidium sp.]